MPTHLYGIASQVSQAGVPEGLRSYIVRVARAHLVSPRRVIKRALADVNPQIEPLISNRFFVKDGRGIDGLGDYASIFSATMNEATGRNDLGLLTLLPWAAILPENGEGALAVAPQWCPVCLVEQDQIYSQRFFPLVWSLKLYQVCTVHQIGLLYACPRCDRTQPFISSFPFVGYCSYCGSDLAGVPAAKERFDCSLEILLEKMVKRNSDTGNCSLEHLRRNLREVIDSRFGANKASFCRALHWDNWKANAWLNKGQKITLPSLLSLTSACGVDVWTLCSHQLPGDAAGSTALSAVIRKRVARCERPDLESKARARLQLQHEIGSHGGRAVNDLCRDLRLRRSALKYWFPQECRQVSTLHRLSKSAAGKYGLQRRLAILDSVLLSLNLHCVPPFRRVVNRYLRPHGLALARPELARRYLQYLVMHGFR